MIKTVFIILFFTISCNIPKTDSRFNSTHILAQNNHKIVLSEKYYKEGGIFEIVYQIDSTIENENIIFTQQYFIFDKIGNLNESGFQGLYNGIGVPVGTTIFYDTKGNVKKEIKYHNDEFGKDYILFKFYEKGKIIRSEKFNNYILYETEKRKIE